jgi:DNA-binding transcriptional LysR family regulator
MIFRQLTHLLALAKAQHFGKAAEAVGISQPGLSASLVQLEQSLGVPIIHRDKRFIGLTPEGQCVLDHARRIQAEIDALKAELADMRQGLTGQLRLGAVPTALPLMSYLTAPFCSKYPQVRISVLSLTSDDIIRRMENFDLDAGVTYLDNEPLERVQTTPLYKEDYVLLVPAKSALARFDRVTWAQAAEAPLCLLSPDMQNRRIIDGIFRSVGVVPEPSVETNSIFNLCSHVSSGHWCSVVPRHVLHFFGQPFGTKVVELVEPMAARTMGLIVSAREPVSVLGLRLMDLAKTLDLAAELANAVRERAP